jgi:hypothetical protein
MKNKTIYHLIIMAIFLISLTGCRMLDKNLGILQLQTKLPVENNVFSSSFPETKLQIGQDLKYLGSVQLIANDESRVSYRPDPREKLLEATSYLFGRMDRDNRIAEGVLIRMLVMHGDPSQEVPEFFSMKNKNPLEAGEMKILEEIYQYDLYLDQALFAKKEKGLLSGGVPSCFLVKRLSIKAGLGNKSRIQILYFEDATPACGSGPCGACLDSQNRTAEKKQFLQGFADRSFASIRFLRTKALEDTTSRYVDTEPKVQPPPVQVAPPVDPPAPAEILPPVSEPVKMDTLEKRLGSLKRVYEKNLISKEDYEKKKAEILKAF